MKKSEFPILEFDTSKIVINPQNIFQKIDIPEHAVICFFNDVIEKLKNEGKAKVITNIKTEAGLNPVYEIEYLGKKAALLHPGIGAPQAAIMLEALIGFGSKKFIVCGAAGVLDKEIAIGHIIVPTAAVRDEGTSYHYLPPSREIEVNKKGIAAIEKVLKRYKCKYLTSKTWTIDASFRETIEKVKLRKEEGCLTVEMECAAFCSIAKYRDVVLAQILYGGDDVSCEEWDSRSFSDKKSIRENIFWLAVEACLEL